MGFNGNIMDYVIQVYVVPSGYVKIAIENGNL